jgi:uncharacterized protein YgiM (DUF1202 family)
MYKGGSTSSKTFKLFTTAYVIPEVLNVRTSASTSSSIKYKLKKGEKVTITENFSEGWVEVSYSRYDSITGTYKIEFGYVSTDYIR